jgi:hypothetical protein
MSQITKRTTEVNKPYYKHQIISPIVILASKIESLVLALSAPLLKSALSSKIKC